MKSVKKHKDIDRKISYFDCAATTFMPDEVMRAQMKYNRDIGVSINRGMNFLSEAAKNIYLDAKDNIKSFFTERKDRELVFFRGATAALNEIIYSLENIIEPMDIIILGPYEHHSNYLPWREMAKRKDAIVFEMPLDSDGNINMEYLKEIEDRIKIVAFSSVSNTNGYQMKASKLEAVLPENAFVIVDDSQKCAHDLIEDSDFIDCHILNSHKMHGPKGIAGALISERMLESMKPCIFGGGMIDKVGFPNVWKQGTEKFEAGTVDVSAIVAWSKACSYIRDIGFERIIEREKEIHTLIWEALKSKDDVNIVSEKNTYSLISFYHSKIHAHDIEEFFSKRGIIVRSGNLCSQNSVAKFNTKALVRISFCRDTKDRELTSLLKAIKELL